MKRRNFLQMLLAVPAALLMRPLAAQAVLRQPDNTGQIVNPTVTLQQSSLAGFQYHAGPSVWPQLRVGQPLSLVREPQNRHDPRAVAVYWRDHKLGYVPRVENTAVAQLLDRAERWLRACIVRLEDDPDPWERVEFLVEVVI